MPRAHESSGWAAALVVTCAAAQAHAAPEWNTAARISLCGEGSRGGLWRESALCTAVGGDILFGRARNDAFAFGPYASLGSADFADLRLSLGGSALLPTFRGDFPVVLSAGLMNRDLERTRAEAQLFFGLRSHNFHGSYAMASGLVLGGSRGFDAGHSSTVYVGLQLDGLWLALPFLVAYEWLRGSPD